MVRFRGRSPASNLVYNNLRVYLLLSPKEGRGTISITDFRVNLFISPKDADGLLRYIDNLTTTVRDGNTGGLFTGGAGARGR